MIPVRFLRFLRLDHQPKAFPKLGEVIRLGCPSTLKSNIDGPMPKKVRNVAKSVELADARQQIGGAGLGVMWSAKPRHGNRENVALRRLMTKRSPRCGRGLLTRSRIRP